MFPRRIWIVAVPFIVIGIGALGYWLGDRAQGKASVDSIEAVADVSGSADAIALRSVPSRFLGTGFEVSGAEGAGCLVPSARGQRVQLGVVHVRPHADGPGRDIVVWVKCFGAPEKIDLPPLYMYPPEERREIRAGLPSPGETVTFTRNRIWGSGSEFLGIPDVRRGDIGTVLAPTIFHSVIVAWGDGPTLAMSAKDLQPA